MIVYLFTCLLVIIIIIIIQYSHARMTPISYAYERGQWTDEGIGTVIASIDTVLMYTPHPPIIRAYCSLRALLSFRGVFACLRNSRAVFLKKLLTPLFSSGHWELETEPSDKLSEVSGAPLNVATNTPLSLNKNARAVLVPDGFGGKVVINFRELAALPDRLSPFPD